MSAPALTRVEREAANPRNLSPSEFLTEFGTDAADILRQALAIYGVLKPTRFYVGDTTSRDLVRRLSSAESANARIGLLWHWFGDEDGSPVCLLLPRGGGGAQALVLTDDLRHRNDVRLVFTSADNRRAYLDAIVWQDSFRMRRDTLNDFRSGRRAVRL